MGFTLQERLTEMTDEEFFDHLLQLFSYTTGAEDTYWDYEDTGETGFDIHSCGEDEQREFVGYFDKEADADFVTAIHGCLPDLVRRLFAACDNAERYEIAYDETQQELAEAHRKIKELKNLITEYEADLQGLLAR
jgi:hypothetical protein